jgi:hypothetical protein
MQKRALALVQKKRSAGTNSQAASDPAPAQPRAQGPAPAQAEAPGQPTLALLPEAPASVNVHLELAGRQVQLTLRDSDEGRLLARLDAVLQRFPLVVTPTDTQARPDGWCTRYGVQMTLHHGKDGRQWYSHKTANGWLKGRWHHPGQSVSPTPYVPFQQQWMWSWGMGAPGCPEVVGGTDGVHSV